MMKITATAATPYSAVELVPVLDVETTVVVEVETAVEAETLTEVVVVVVVLVVVTVAVLVVAGGTFCRVKATTSPAVDPGQVATASGLHVPTGRIRYSCPLTDAPIVTPWSIGAPM